MAISSLSPNGKVMLETPNSLNYTNSQGEQALKNPETALTEIVREVNNVNQMGQRTSVSIQDKNDDYTRYYVNQTKDGNLVLQPNPEAQVAGKEAVYFNKKYDTDDKGNVKRTEQGEPLFYFVMNKEAPAAQELLNNMKVKENNGYQNLAVSVQIANPELAKELKEYQRPEGDNSKVVAILSKDEIKISTVNELASAKAERSSQEQTKAEPQKSQDMDR